MVVSQFFKLTNSSGQNSSNLKNWNNSNAKFESCSNLSKFFEFEKLEQLSNFAFVIRNKPSDFFNQKNKGSHSRDGVYELF